MMQKENPAFAAYAGIDWADKKHDICLQFAGESDPQYSVLKHTPEALDQWARELRKRVGGQPVAVCLEQTKGPLIYGLLKYEFLVLYPVNPQSLAKYRQAFAPSQAKDDPTDAALQLDFLLKHRERLKAWSADDPQTRALQSLVESRKRLAQEKVRLTNQITSHLKDYFPQVLEWFADRDTGVFSDFLTRWPTLPQVQQARKSTLVAFFRSHNSHPPFQQQRLESIQTAVALTEDEAIIQPSVLLVEGLLAQLKTLQGSLQRLGEEIQQRFQQHPDFFIFHSLPGAGPVFGPRLLAAFGSDRSRYEGAEDLLKYAGIAPVLQRSGQKSWVHWRYACPKFLRQTFVEWSAATIQRSFWATLYYQQKRQQGHSHAAAVRALAFKWIRILFRCWQDRKPYDEATYLRALKTQHSPLLAQIQTLPLT